MIIAWIPKPGKSPRGCGKSGGMTWKLHQDKLLKGRKVVTNFDCAFQDDTITSKILNDMPKDLKKMSMGATEVHTILEARRGQKSKQIRITYFILQTRKRDVDFHYDTQSLRQVERRLVEQTDIIIQCENLGCGKMECSNQSCGLETCGIFHYEVYDGHTGRFLGEFWLNGPRDFYNLYDSEEVITDFAEPDDED